MKLSDKAFSELKIGSKVRKENGLKGNITALIAQENTVSQVDDEIIVTWENGQIYHAWHYWFQHIDVTE